MIKKKLIILYVKIIIYNIIKFPLIIIFIKTPLINILKKRFKYFRYRKNKNIIWFVLDMLFQREYLRKLKNKEEIRKLSDSTIMDGEGRKWAESIYNKHFKTFDELKKRRLGTMSYNEAFPIFENIINFIKSNHFLDHKDTYFIQLGSCSGRDLEFFLKIFPKLNYISTDINDEILNFQKEKYNYLNLKYFKCHAEDIDKCINYFNIAKKNIILCSIGVLEYVNSFFLEEFFLKLKKYQSLNLFLNESVNLKFIDSKKEMTKHRGNISFSHRYDEYVKNSGLNILKYKLIRPYSEDDKKHSHTGQISLHASN